MKIGTPKTYQLEKNTTVAVHTPFLGNYSMAIAELNGPYPQIGKIAHNVNRNEYIVVVTGRITLTINGVVYDLKAGDNRLIEDGDYYAITGKAKVAVFVHDGVSAKTEILHNLDVSALYDVKNAKAGSLYDAMTSKTKIEEYSWVAKEIIKAANSNEIRILDVGCGTAILGEKLLESKNIKYVGLDYNKSFIAQAKPKLSSRPDWDLIIKDIFSFNPKSKFEIITLTSVYHHFPRDKRVRLLRKLKNLLTPKGLIIIYEKVIPKFSTQQEYANACRIFYESRITYLKKQETGFSPQQELNLKQLRDLSVLGRDPVSGEIELKADYQEIFTNFKKSGLKLTREIKIDTIFSEQRVGDLLFVVQ